MDSQAYARELLENIAMYKDLHGGRVFGRRKRRTRRRSMRGKGLISEKSFNEEDQSFNEEGDGIYGLGVYGLEGEGRRRRRKAGTKRRAGTKRKVKFDIGKYSHAISRGKSKAEARAYARGAGVNALY